MIVIDRTLGESERADLVGQSVMDLTEKTPSGGKGPREGDLWRWLDLVTERTLSGQTPFDFFKLGRSSYWLHVRARMFHTMLTHAQMLDRLGDYDVLEKVDRVYCAASDVDFWKWWAPQAGVVVDDPGSPKQRVSLSRFVWDELKKMPGYLRSLARARRRGAAAVLFTSSQFNTNVHGELVDREFAPVLGLCPGPWVRIEYHPLPTVGMEARAPALRDGPRAHPTVESNAVLAGYLLARPYAVLTLVSRLRRIKRRFETPPEHEFPFADPGGRWLALLHREIRRVGPSIALLSLLENAFERILAKLAPRVALVSGENNSPGRTLVAAARGLRIPTIGIQHGDIGPTNVDYCLNAAEAAVGLPDYFLTWGDRTREFLVRYRHYPVDRTVVVGHLRSDRREVTPDETMEKLRAGSSRRILLFTSQLQPFRRNWMTSARLLAEFCVQYDLLCVLKLHPREMDGEVYQRTFSQAGISDQLHQIEGDLYGMIASCDVGATCYSTTAWEMMGARKPVVVFDPFHMDLLGLRGEEAVYHAGDPGSGDFEGWYTMRDRHLLEAERLVTRFFGPRDGNSAQRVVDVVESVAGPICGSSGRRDSGPPQRNEP